MGAGAGGVATLGLKCKLVILIFGETRHQLMSEAYAQRKHQFLTRTLSARISS
jgi:hypothetical protein